MVGALAMDVVVGELPTKIHPVAWFGGLVNLVDREYVRERLVGVALAVALPAGVALAIGIGVASLGVVHSIAGAAVGAFVLFVTTSFRALLETGRRVGRLASADVEAARTALPALAGRDAATLDAAAIRSATIESLAENLADGLVAPLVGFTVGAIVGRLLGVPPASALALACAGAVWVKGVNTMDSMWGYPGRPLGTGAAKLDDLAMWLPARVTAGLVVLTGRSPGVVPRAARWRDAVASPNAGWPMGVLAGVLDVRLEKPGHYVLNAEARAPTPADVSRGLWHVGLAGLLAYALTGGVLWY
mgnify:CR=1 FL=1